MKYVATQQDREFLQVLNRLGDQANIHRICAALGVTATAVRQRIERLQELGLIERRLVKAKRGRPYHIYATTSAGFQQLGDLYHVLAPLLWQAIQKIENEDDRRNLLAQIRDGLVKRYEHKITAENLPERMQQLSTALKDDGFDMECRIHAVEESDGSNQDLPVLSTSSCLFREIAYADNLICELERSVFAMLVDADICLKQRCVDGNNCCEFQVGSHKISGNG